MAISKIFAYLVHPGKKKTNVINTSANEISQKGSLHDMLNDIFSAKPDSRDFEVTFNHTIEGKKQNDCRDLMCQFQANPTIENGELIANRLQRCTDDRSGVGLLFLIIGQYELKHRLVVSRFPTDKAILAEVAEEKLEVEFLEQVFIKKFSAYKALLIEHSNPSAGFWSGIATDRQAGGYGENISDYWINGFLNADFSETPSQGTKRLVMALRDVAKKNPNLEVKTEIASAITSAARIFKDKVISIDSFCEHFRFSESTKGSLKSHLSKASLYTKTFKFDNNEFKKRAPYRTLEIDNGAILTAPSDNFEEVFSQSQINDEKVEYTTIGRVKDHRIARK